MEVTDIMAALPKQDGSITALITAGLLLSNWFASLLPGRLCSVMQVPISVGVAMRVVMSGNRTGICSVSIHYGPENQVLTNYYMKVT